MFLINVEVFDPAHVHFYLRVFPQQQMFVHAQMLRCPTVGCSEVYRHGEIKLSSVGRWRTFTERLEVCKRHQGKEHLQLLGWEAHQRVTAVTSAAPRHLINDGINTSSYSLFNWGANNRCRSVFVREVYLYQSWDSSASRWGLWLEPAFKCSQHKTVSFGEIKEHVNIFLKAIVSGPVRRTPTCVGDQEPSGW